MPDGSAGPREVLSSWLRTRRVVSPAIRLVDSERSSNPWITRQHDLSAIERHLRAALGEACEVHVEFVSDIPTARSGKFRAVISEVAGAHLLGPTVALSSQRKLA